MISVDIAVPVYNEERVLEDSVHRLTSYLRTTFPWRWRVVIVDNASTDSTWSITNHLAREMDRVIGLHLDRKGRGLALRTAWTVSTADVVAYMDVDLSTDLRALLPLVAPLVSGHSDVSIGTRWHHAAQVTRGPKRRAVSWTFNQLLQTALGVRFTDAMCGFKAMRADAATLLLPMVADDQWFFDAELLTMAERVGMRIHEVPLDWVDDPDSRVDVVKTAKANLRGIWRLSHGAPARAHHLALRAAAPVSALDRDLT